MILFQLTAKLAPVRERMAKVSEIKFKLDFEVMTCALVDLPVLCLLLNVWRKVGSS